MRKIWVVFWLFLFAGLMAVSFYTKKDDSPKDTPSRVPDRSEVVPNGLSTRDLIRTSDESRIPELMQSTPTVKLVTDRLLAITCNPGTDLCKLQSIYDFVRKNYQYQLPDGSHDWIQSPGETLIYTSGDQLELALLIASMDRAAGYDSEILKGDYNTYVRTTVNNLTITVDPSCQSCSFMDTRVTTDGSETVFK